MATLGVTGHRVLCEQGRITASIDQVLHRLEREFPGKPLTLLTSLAEGSDRLVAASFRRLENARIVAVLPLTPDDYLADFATEESRKEFLNYMTASNEIIQMPPASDRNAAYEAAGRYVLDHCDAFICIWDGQNAQGRGGTGELVQRARERKIPIAWIHAGNRRPGTMEPISLGPEQGMITYENFN